MRYKRRSVLLIIIICLLLYFAPAILAGYKYSEYTAIRKSYPFQDGKLVFEEDFNNNKIVIWDTGKEKYVKLVNQKWGILYRADIISEINSISPGEKVGVTWSGRLTRDKRYETIFGVEVVNDKISQIVISNDKYGDKLESKEEIKNNSSLYIEMPVKNGYAAYYSKLSINDTGNFVFRGIDTTGKIVFVKD